MNEKTWHNTYPIVGAWHMVAFITHCVETARQWFSSARAPSVVITSVPGHWAVHKYFSSPWLCAWPIAFLHHVRITCGQVACLGPSNVSKRDAYYFCIEVFSYQSSFFLCNVSTCQDETSICQGLWMTMMSRTPGWPRLTSSLREI